jgi:hypothetical protein
MYSYVCSTNLIVRVRPRLLCMLLLTTPHRCGALLFSGLRNSMQKPLAELMKQDHKEELKSLKALFRSVDNAIKSKQAGTTTATTATTNEAVLQSSCNLGSGRGFL